MFGKTAFLAAALAVTLTPYGDSAHAADESQVSCSLRLPQQALDSALAEIARQCGVQLICFSAVTQDKTASGLEGSYSVETALDKVLVGTGLAFRRVNPNTIEIRSAPAARRGGALNGTLAVYKIIQRGLPAYDFIDSRMRGAPLSKRLSLPFVRSSSRGV